MPTKLSKIIADFETQLATKLSAGSDSCNLQSATDDDGVALPDGQYFFTLDGDNSQKEHIVATLTGIALSDIKSISRQGAQTDNAVREHRIGASVKITDFAHIKYMNDLLDGTTGFDSAMKLGYDADPGIDSSDLYKFATVAFVNDSLVSGAPNASTNVKGIVEEATTAEINADDTTGSTGARLSINPSSLILSKYGLQLPSVGEKAALSGSSGQVNTYNKYLTEDDASNFGGGVSQALQNSVLAIGEANATTKFNRAMQTFIATNTSQIAVNVNKQANTGTNAGDVIVELFAVDGSGDPTGSALASVTITAATWNALPVGNNYTVLNYTFVIGTTYALQFRQSTADNANHANIGYQNTDVYANGTLKRWNVTDGWVAVTGDLTFYLFGSINNKVVRRTNSGTVFSPAPSAGSDLANKTYVDAADANAGEKISVVSSEVDVNNTTTETNLVSVAIPSGTLSTNNAVRLKMYIKNVSRTSGTFILRFKYGVTTLVTTSSLTITSGYTGWIEFTLVATGATNTQKGMSIIYLAPNVTSGSTSNFNFNTVDYGTSAIDSTASQNLVATVQFSDANPSNGIQMYFATIEKIR